MKTEHKRDESIHEKAMRDVRVSPDGKIIPTAEALERTKRDYPTETAPEQYRLAQAATLFEAMERVRKQ